MNSKYRLISKTKQIILLLLIMHLLTACPSPEKVGKVIEMHENQKLYEKFERVFNQSVNKQKSNLIFGYAAENDRAITIYLDLKPVRTTSDWQGDLIDFQKRLKQTNTKYQTITVNNGGSYLCYGSEELAVYEKSYKLFQKNLDQIKEDRIDDLYKTMRKTDLKYNTIKELFDYIQVTNFDNTKLISYPCQDFYAYDRVIFCLKDSESTTLYFSYLSTESGLSLHAIDLNNIPKEINLTYLVDKIKK